MVGQYTICFDICSKLLIELLFPSIKSLNASTTSSYFVAGVFLFWINNTKKEGIKRRTCSYKVRPYLGHTAGTSQRDFVQQFLQSRWAFSEFAAQLPVAQQSWRLLLKNLFFLATCHSSFFYKCEDKVENPEGPGGFRDGCHWQTPTNYLPAEKSGRAGRLLCCIQVLQ